MRTTMALMLLALGMTVCAQAQQGGKTASPTTVQGCLQYNHRHYVLTETNGTSHELHGKSSMLKPHIGHEVEVTGTEAVHNPGRCSLVCAHGPHPSSVQPEACGRVLHLRRQVGNTTPDSLALQEAAEARTPPWSHGESAQPIANGVIVQQLLVDSVLQY